MAPYPCRFRPASLTRLRMSGRIADATATPFNSCGVLIGDFAKLMMLKGFF